VKLEPRRDFWKLVKCVNENDILTYGYLYVSSIVFLVGVQIDEIVREDAKGGTDSGQSRRGSRTRRGQRQHRRSKASSGRARAA